MSHLLSGFGVPDGPLSFDHVLVTWMVVQMAVVILLAVTPGLAPAGNGGAAGRRSRSATHRRSTPAKRPRPPRRRPSSPDPTMEEPTA